MKDDAKAAAYFKSAIGQCNATSELANCYYEGAGVVKNLTTARTLFKKAADKNNAEGDDNLGAMMILGEGGAEEVGKGTIRGCAGALICWGVISIEATIPRLPRTVEPRPRVG